MSREVKMILPSWTLEFGTKKILIDSNIFDGHFCSEMAEAIAEIRAEDSDFAEDKFPAFPNESMEDYEKRIAKERKNYNMMRLPEDTDGNAHAKRLNMPAMDTHKFCWKFLNWYAIRTGQVGDWKETEENNGIWLAEKEFKSAVFQRVRDVLYKALIGQAELPVTEVYPKS